MTGRDAEGIIACSRSVERSDTTGYCAPGFHIPAGMAAIEQVYDATETICGPLFDCQRDPTRISPLSDSEADLNRAAYAGTMRT